MRDPNDVRITHDIQWLGSRRNGMHNLPRSDRNPNPLAIALGIGAGILVANLILGIIGLCLWALLGYLP